MKTLSFAALLAALALTQVGCLPEAESANGSSAPGVLSIERDQPSRAYLHSYNLPSHGVAVEGYCPVAYFTEKKPVRGKAEHASTHDGVTYHLASAEAKEAFDADPRRYIPAFGGWCAYGMAVRDKFPVDPERFKIVDGRLFLFLNNRNVDALELWDRGNEDELVREAEAHWKRVQG